MKKDISRRKDVSTLTLSVVLVLLIFTSVVSTFVVLNSNPMIVYQGSTSAGKVSVSLMRSSSAVNDFTGRVTVNIENRGV